MRRLILAAAAVASLAATSTASAAAPQTIDVTGKMCRQVQLTKAGKVKRDRLGYAKVAYRGTPKRLRRRACASKTIALSLDRFAAYVAANPRKVVARSATYGGHPGIATEWGCYVARENDAALFRFVNPHHSDGWPSGDIVSPRTWNTTTDVSFSCGRERVAPLWQSFSCDMDDQITGANNSSLLLVATAHCVGGGGEMYPATLNVASGFGSAPFSWLADIGAEGGWTG